MTTVSRTTSVTHRPATSTERGASLVEYALLVGLIAIVCFGAISFLGQQPGPVLQDVGSSLAAN